MRQWTENGLVGWHEMRGDGRRAGVDAAPQTRPGVPMEAEPPHVSGGSHWERPPEQEARTKVFHRPGLDRLTPVFGTAQPPRGLSGLMRGIAYGIPDHRARRWALLLAADRVDVVESRVAELVASPFKLAGLNGVARRIERRPVLAMGLGFAAGLGLAAAVRRTRQRGRATTGLFVI